MTTITTTSPLPNATLSSPYSTTIVAAGGTAPYTYVLDGFALPSGLSLNSSTGVISGVPTGPIGTFAFSVQATDSLAASTTKNFNLTLVSNYNIGFRNAFLPSAGLNLPYSQVVEPTNGVAPYTFAVAIGSLPPGLSFDNTTGVISGTATTLGVYYFSISVTDANAVSAQISYQFSVINFVDLSSITVDQGQFAQQLQNSLSQSSSWSTGLTTQTSQTLIELVSAIGTFDTSKIIRAREDSFSETAQSDSGIRAIANMQGLRLNRKLPAVVSVSLTNPTVAAISIPAYTQFAGAGYNWFNTEVIELDPTTTHNGIPLKEGTLVSATLNGRGTDLQAWVSTEDAFQVSDQDVIVGINGATLAKSFGGLWNFQGLNAFADSTLSDGRLLIQFGSNSYGAVPGVNDVVTINYATTSGSSANGAPTVAAKVTTADFPVVTGSFDSNPSGGADEKSPLVYKNFASGTFGTYGSGVTKAQYHALVNNYPGIIDAVTQAQREINPSALEWMNIIRVAGLTNSAWSQPQIQEFLNYMESVTMFTPKFVWQDPVSMPRDVDISVYCFNSVQSLTTVNAAVTAAIRKLFSPRPGLLMTNFYLSDLVEAAMDAAPGQISYVVVNNPLEPMIVTSPPSPIPTYTVVPSGGTLTPRVYTYSIAVDVDNNGTTDYGNPTEWVFPQVVVNNSQVVLDWTNAKVANALNYHIWGRRAGFIGKLATVGPLVTTFTDDGSITPVPEPTNVSDTFIRYNALDTLVVNTFYAGRQSKATFPVRETL